MSERGSAETPWPGQFLKTGANGPDVELVQEWLRVLNYEPGGNSGLFDRKTSSALVRFQADRKMTADGVAGPQTWERLAADAAAVQQPRAAGDPEVRRVQEELLAAGFDPGPANGVSGPETEAAVRLYQLVHGLQVTGRVDQPTRRALLEQQLRISGTVAEVASSVLGPTTPSELAGRVLARHSGYGAGRLASTRLRPHASEVRFDSWRWLAEVRQLFRAAAAPKLHGRLVVVGLALLDVGLAELLASNGFLDAVIGEIDEIEEPFDTLLTERGRQARRRARETADLVHRLSPAAATALAQADDLRARAGQSRVHMEHLLVALDQEPDGPLPRLLRHAGVGPEGLAAALTEAGLTTPAPSGATPALVSLPPLSGHAGPAVDHAVRLADATGSPAVHSRHLLHGALTVEGCALVDALARRGVRAADVEDWSEPIPDPLPAAPRPTLLAGTAADTVPEPGDGRVRGADRLGTAADVEVLASVLLARDTPLPLAVGLFGDWGSGKSFLMAHLQERMEELAALSRAGRPEAAPYCGKVRPIRFNAWHYVDSNLWASLAATLFDELAHADAPEAADEKLGELAQAQERFVEARSARVALEQDAERLEAQAGRPARAAGAAVEAAIKAVRDEPDLASRLDQATAAPTADRPTEALIAAVGAVDGTAAKARTAWQLFREEVLHRRSVATLVTFAVLAGVAVVASVAIGWPALAKAATIVAAALVALAPALRAAIRTLSIAQAAREERERPLQDKRLEVDAARTVEEAAEREVAQRERELAELRDLGEQLRQYVRTRATSSDYRNQLGVISMVRRDFEQFVKLRSAAGPQQVAAAATAVAAVPDVERIVLFIDDLDRCPHEKVVDVLQAVHLLLAFDLFVVVVGVDSRWLARSLRAHYENLLEEPESYLEKIFQIPFTLRPMADPHYRDLIDDLTPPAVRVAPTAGAPEDRPVDRDLPADRPAREPLPDERVAGRPAPAAPTRPEPPVLPRPEALVLSGAERTVLRELGGLIRTPRATKRLVNIYRMLRVSVPHDELNAFEPEGGDEYQAVVLLLAVLLRRPPVADAVFARMLAAADDADVWQILAGFPDLHDDLAPLRNHIKLDRVAPYRRWVPRVSRFSMPTP